ncbi:hypothetical protein C0J52_24731 [Blattella germanica]|nr:hypothetical protein C0J52_24731 [Blattella germanica]
MKQERIGWAGHVQRMSETCTVKKVFVGKLEGSRRTGRPMKNGLTMLRKTLGRLELL